MSFFHDSGFGAIGKHHSTANAIVGGIQSLQQRHSCVGTLCVCQMPLVETVGRVPQPTSKLGWFGGILPVAGIERQPQSIAPGQWDWSIECFDMVGFGAQSNLHFGGTSVRVAKLDEPVEPTWFVGVVGALLGGVAVGCCLFLFVSVCCCVLLFVSG